MLNFLLFYISFFFASPSYCLEYSKVEFDGCPENAYCKKETGINRKKWIEYLKDFSRGKISEQKINYTLQSEFGLPIEAWAQENASMQPNILMWDSPCRQHQNTSNKYYIAEIFRKNLKLSETAEINSVFFARAVFLDKNNRPFSYAIPRGDAALFLKNSQLYFLKEEEGVFYGLLVDKDGMLKIVKNESSPFPPKEASCSKDQIALFLREAPSPNFYQGYYCKEIWDKDSKNYRNILFGWSCN